MNMNEWWKNTFGAEYLEAFRHYYSPAKTKIEVDFLRKFIGLKRGSRILDIPCGQGRHTAALARSGYQVTGIDHSSILLKEAKRTIMRDAGHAVLRRGDMRKISGAKKFDAVVTLGNSFGYFSDDDNARFLASVSKHLIKGGIFVLDLSNTSGLIRHPLGTFDYRFKGGVLTTSAYAFDPLSMRLKIKWKIAIGKKVKSTAGEIRLYTAPEIFSLLEQTGMRVKSVFGDFIGHPYDLESPRLIIVSKKT